MKLILDIAKFFALIILAIFVLWQFSFRNVIEKKKELNHIISEKNSIPALQEEQSKLNTALETVKKTCENSKGSVLETISYFADENDLRITHFPQIRSFQNNHLTIRVLQFSLRGEYSKLLQFVYFLEQEVNICKIKGLHWEVLHEKGNDKEFLRLTIYATPYDS